ncbi:SAVED domain-containing protein [Nocardia nova]
MTTVVSRQPQLSVVGTSQPAPSHGWQAWRDGTIASTAGGIIIGGCGIETYKSFVSHDHDARWWMLAGTVLGLLLLVGGGLQRRKTRRQHSVAIVATAPDTARGLAGAGQLDQQAERYAQQRCTVTLKTQIPTADGQRPDRALIEALADTTLEAIAMAERLSPDATQFHLVPTMPLHAGFWFGARLGNAHARDIRIHQLLRGNGERTYFDATSLRPHRTKGAPLSVDGPRNLAGDPSRAALAIDLQGRGDSFDAEVAALCTQQNIGVLLTVRTVADGLENTEKAFEAAVTQITDAWKRAPMTPDARVGIHTAILSGPLSIGVALGANLASAEYGRWRAFSFNRAAARYEELPQSNP